MRLINVPVEDLVVTEDLSRSRSSKVFQDHLYASIQEMGLAEPLKVAELPSKGYVVIDGVIRLRAIQKLREKDESIFITVPAYVVDYKHRFEIRYQTDIYQDLLPSQLATLVEHLHRTENVRKTDIARYIGVSPATLRNYTGLWRLTQRGGLFKRIVDLMDVGVIPASNPYAWLRLTDSGLSQVLISRFCNDGEVEEWIDDRITRARGGDIAPYQLKYIESTTSDLPPHMYREDEEVRSLKRQLGLRRGAAVVERIVQLDASSAIDNLLHVIEKTRDPVLRLAANGLVAYLR